MLRSYRDRLAAIDTGRRRACQGLAGLALGGAVVVSWAQESPYPAKPIRIVPFSTAGGPIDTIARLYGERLTQRWGQPVVVDAKPGASGIVAADFVSRAPPENERVRGRVRQPWYPVQNLYGLVWAYLGPPDKKPLLPRYDMLEVLDEGEFLETDATSIGGGGPVVIPCNWLQHYENLVDPFHVVILHAAFSGTQFVPAMAVMPQVSWDTVESGVRTTSIRHLPDGCTLRRISEAALPTLRVIPSPRIGQYGRVESLGWVLPIDDHHFRIYTVGRVRAAGDLVRVRSRLNGKLWEELSEAEHQAFPGDYEAMVSQGKIAPHSAEHLATSDRGIATLRRLLRRQLDALREGRDPAGVIRDPAAPPVRFEAGNFLIRP